MSKEFTHLDQEGNPTMVDVGEKAVTSRTATAKAEIYLPDEVFQHLEGKEIETKKGPVFQTAILAGIMASKKTSDLIPLCHPLGLDQCSVSIEVMEQNLVRITATTKIQAKTGVEMEALTAVSISALTVYDMCKAFSHDIAIREIKLMSKHGGKRDFERSD